LTQPRIKAIPPALLACSFIDWVVFSHNYNLNDNNLKKHNYNSFEALTVKVSVHKMQKFK